MQRLSPDHKERIIPVNFSWLTLLDKQPSDYLAADCMAMPISEYLGIQSFRLLARTAIALACGQKAKCNWGPKSRPPAGASILENRSSVTQLTELAELLRRMRFLAGEGSPNIKVECALGHKLFSWASL
jgi:hypothetical protein